MTNIFTAIGVATVVVFGFMLSAAIVDFILNEIHEAIWGYINTNIVLTNLQQPPVIA